MCAVVSGCFALSYRFCADRSVEIHVISATDMTFSMISMILVLATPYCVDVSVKSVGRVAKTST